MIVATSGTLSGGRREHCILLYVESEKARRLKHLAVERDNQPCRRSALRPSPGCSPANEAQARAYSGLHDQSPSRIAKQGALGRGSSSSSGEHRAGRADVQGERAGEALFT